MLSEEEKKAIKVINKRIERLEEELKIELEDKIDEPTIAYLTQEIEANKIILNLIEKQQKEIEELKEDISHMYHETVVRNILENECGLSKDEIDELLEEE